MDALKKMDYRQVHTIPKWMFSTTLLFKTTLLLFCFVKVYEGLFSHLASSCNGYLENTLWPIVATSSTKASFSHSPLKPAVEF